MFFVKICPKLNYKDTKAENMSGINKISIPEKEPHTNIKPGAGCVMVFGCISDEGCGQLIFKNNSS